MKVVSPKWMTQLDKEAVNEEHKQAIDKNIKLKYQIVT